MNLPTNALESHQNILIAGLGSGFDVFAGLPFVYHYPNKNFILVNISPNDKFHFHESTIEDYPEGNISKHNNISKIYTIGKHGCMAVKKAYESICAENNIDFILAVDGGVDSLATGDEEENGTILEDFISLAALQDIKVDKMVCCIGFGTETEENMNHYRILENIAELIKDNGFIGSFSLTKNMLEFEKYSQECERVWEDRRKSHIHTKVISAVKGGFLNNQYENIDPQLVCSTGIEFISALSSIYWFFNFESVARKNKVLPILKKSNTFVDAKLLLRQYLNNIKKRTKEAIPL